MSHTDGNDMITDNPDTDSSPAESPSSRPMTLRQQILPIIANKLWQGKSLEYVAKQSDKELTGWDEVISEIERVCQEIAREALEQRNEALDALGGMWLQYCPKPYTHMSMRAGEHAEEVLENHGLLKNEEFDEEAMERLKAELTQKPPQHKETQ